MKSSYSIIILLGAMPGLLWADTHNEVVRPINTAYGLVYPADESGIKRVEQRIGTRIFRVEYSRTKMGKAPQAKVTHERVNGEWVPMVSRPGITKISPVLQTTQDGTLYGFEFEGEQGGAYTKLVNHEGKKVWVPMTKSHLATGEAVAPRFRDPTEKEILSTLAKIKAEALEASADKQLNDANVQRVIHNNSDAFRRMREYYGVNVTAPSKQTLFSRLPFREHSVAPGARMVSLPTDPMRPTLRVTITEEELNSRVPTILGMRASGDLVDYLVRRNEILGNVGKLSVDLYNWATGPKPISTAWGNFKSKAENFDPRKNNPNLLVIAHVGDGIDDGIAQAQAKLDMLPNVVAANVWLQARQKNSQKVDSRRFMVRNRERVKNRKNKRMEKAASSNSRFVTKKYDEKLSEGEAEVAQAVSNSKRDTGIVLREKIKELAYAKAAQLENNAYLLGTDSDHSGFGVDINNSTPRGIALVMPTSDGRVYELNGIEKRGDDGKHLIPLPLTGAYRNAVLRHYNEHGKLTRHDLYSISIQYGFFPSEDGTIKFHNPEKRIGPNELKTSFIRKAKEHGGLTKRDVQEYILMTQGIAIHH